MGDNYPKSLKSRRGSYKPEKTFNKGTRKFALQQKMKATLGDGANLYDAVCLPPGENLNEWIAVSLVDFYNDLSLLFGGISELCTKQTCPVMSAGPNFQYLWPLPTGPVKLCAHDYVDNLFIWIDEKIDDPNIFPFDDDQEFPPDFIQICQTILKRSFRVYAHIYHSHFTQFVQLEAEKHLNSCFKRFIFFVVEFRMVDAHEFVPMQQLIIKHIEESGSEVGKAKLAEAMNKANSSSTTPKSSEAKKDSGTSSKSSATAAPVGSAPQPSLNGFLWKLPPKHAPMPIGKWQQRYFERQGDQLIYYRDDTKMEKRGSIDLRKVTSVQAADPSSPHQKPEGRTAFRLFTEPRIWVLSTEDNGRSASDWMQAFEDTIAQLQIS